MAVVINEDSELLSQGVNLKSDTAVIESVMILSFNFGLSRLVYIIYSKNYSSWASWNGKLSIIA